MSVTTDGAAADPHWGALITGGGSTPSKPKKQPQLKQWVRVDKGAWSTRTTNSSGPPWPLVRFRRTVDLNTKEVLEEKQEINATNPEVHHRVLDKVRDLETTLFFEEPLADVSGMEKFLVMLDEDKPKMVREALLAHFEENDPDFVTY